MLPSLILAIALFLTILLVVALIVFAKGGDETSSLRILIVAVLFAAAWAFYHYLTH